MVKFKIGYYYKYILDTPGLGWVPSMNSIIDNKFHKCIGLGHYIPRIKQYQICFSGIEGNFLWGDEANFIEKPPVDDMLKEIYDR